jgi:predicted Zn finger-like uncharacterized protein
MDVRCERCRAQYVFDDEQVTAGGLTVQCTNCGHVFKVKVKELVVTVPVKPGEEEAAPIPATAAAPKPPGATAAAMPAVTPAPPPEPPPAPAAAPAAPASPPGPIATGFFAQKGDEKAKEWRVRQGNGNVFTFKELTTLQKWIVEQKVTRDDEISLTGDQWKRLGNIAELASFFQVVEAAGTARTQAQMPAVTPLPMQMPAMPTVVVQAPGGYAPPSYPPPYPGYLPPPGYSLTPNPPPSVAAPPPAPAPPPPAPAPRPTQVITRQKTQQIPRPTRAVGRAVDVQMTDRELGAVKKSGAWKSVLLLALLLAAGAAGALYFWRPELLGLAHKSSAITIEVKVPEVATPVVGDPVPAEKPAETAPMPAPEPVGEAPLPKSPVPVQKPEPPAPKPEAAPKGPKQLLAEAQRLRGTQPERALALYEKVAQLQPRNAKALAGQGLCYLDLQQYTLAEQSFRLALQADPEEPDALLGMAEAARYQGKKSEAIQHYERYLALHPDGDDAVAARNAISQLKE